MEKSGRKRKRTKKAKKRLPSISPTVNIDSLATKDKHGYVENNLEIDKQSESQNHECIKRKSRKKRKKITGSSNAIKESVTVDSILRKQHLKNCLSSTDQHESEQSCIVTKCSAQNDEPGFKGDISNRKSLKKVYSLKERLQNKLESGRFRWINEKLYTSSSKCASELFEKDPALFKVYHQGFSSQVQKWPVNPVDVMIKWIKQRSPKLIIVDMGCGEAKISQSVPNQVHSFDLVAANKFVTVCDMAKVPLPDSSVHVVIYCLSLMGTNLNDFLKESHRILKYGGIMKVAEVVSRFNDMERFENAVSGLGFSLQSKDTTNKIFVQFEFTKRGNDVNSQDFLPISLKPCLYKKR